MHKKIPGVCDERSSDKGSPAYQIGHGETNPDLPKESEDRLVGVGMMQPVLGWRKAMQHKAVNKIFGRVHPITPPTKSAVPPLIRECEIASRTMASKDATNISPR